MTNCCSLKESVDSWVSSLTTLQLNYGEEGGGQQRANRLSLLRKSQSSQNYCRVNLLTTPERCFRACSYWKDGEEPLTSTFHLRSWLHLYDSSKIHVQISIIVQMPMGLLTSWYRTQVAIQRSWMKVLGLELYCLDGSEPWKRTWLCISLHGWHLGLFINLGRTHPSPPACLWMNHYC